MEIITSKQFKKLILLETLLVSLVFFSAFIPNRFYGDELQSYLNSYGDDPGSWDLVLVLFAFIASIWTVQNLYALYKFKTYSRRHAVILTLLGSVWYLLYPLEPFVELGIPALLYDAAVLLWGFILALIYFTNIAENFKSRKP